MYDSVEDIRDEFHYKLVEKDFVIDKTGVKTIELVGASFVADEDHIFGLPNGDYVEREKEWYLSQSLRVDNFPDGAPDLWHKVSSKTGFINSNYGWIAWSSENYNQYANVLKELMTNPFSRRALMIYTRPQMHYDYNIDGMSDFICTNAVQYVIRHDELHAVVQMRSNDAWSGYRNDRAWQMFILEKLAADLGVTVGSMVWQVGSLHFYEPQFYLVDHYSATGESAITKARYRELYPDAEWWAK